MGADTEFPMAAADIRKRAVQLRAFIDQGDFSPTDEESLLGQVFSEDEIEWLEENEEKIFMTLERIDEDYAKLVNASTDIEQGQDALDAHIQVLAFEPDDDDDGDDPDGDLD